MLAGPIFTREAITLPRQIRHYLTRSGYVLGCIVLMYTAMVVTLGFQQVRNVGDIARFGSLVFQLFSVVQLTLALFFALLLAAGNIAQEKDRQTLLLLLMTELRDREVVLGKLFASLLGAGVLLATSIPIFAMVYLLGGVRLDQISWSIAICAASALAAGSWGGLVGFWREKTFQTLAISVLGLVLLVGVAEAVIGISQGHADVVYWVSLLNPYRALFTVLDPFAAQTGLEPLQVSAIDSVLAMLSLSVVLTAVTAFRLRVWNPSQAVFTSITIDEEKDQRTNITARKQHRNIWRTPVIWREIRTRAYGRRIIFIKLAYALLSLFAFLYLLDHGNPSHLFLGVISPSGLAFVGLSLLSLILINAQAVTALTSERDGKTLEFLLMTEVTAKEFIFGKLGGVLYNTKELILIPLLVIGYDVFLGEILTETFVFVAISYLVLVLFTSMLGLHSGLSYENSRSAIANSLGTIFFLFIGIFVFMLLLVEARGSFFLQFQSFTVFIGIGSIALYVSLSRINPSPALRLSAGVLPFLTFYAITEFLLNGTLSVSLAISLAYGFTTLAMLIPAISEFDVALGRTTLDQG